MTPVPDTHGAGRSARITPATRAADIAALTLLDFGDIPGWASDDHYAALSVFLRGCLRPAPRDGALGISGSALHGLCRDAMAATSGEAGEAAARVFFEQAFVPVRLDVPGFVTGYFEPSVAASRTRTKRFHVPLYRKPADLVKIDSSARRAAREAGLPEDLAFARRGADARLHEYFDRAAIEGGALADRGLELAWIEDPLDAFFIHIQGSARLSFADGSTMRLSYAAKSGHPYTAIGRILIERGEILAQDMTMERLRAWMEAHRQAARVLMEKNRSYIFFREVQAGGPGDGPIGAAGVPLTAGRSLAVDHRLHGFGTPIFLRGTLPLGPDGASRPFARLMIAQDTGSAIVGPARGDIFIGTGDAAGRVAGEIKHAVDFIVLAPRGSSLVHRAAGEVR